MTKRSSPAGSGQGRRGPLRERYKVVALLLKRSLGLFGLVGRRRSVESMWCTAVHLRSRSLNIVSLSDMIEGSYRSLDLYTTGQLVDGLQQKRKPVFIKRKWNHAVFSRVTILSFHPVYIYIYIFIYMYIFLPCIYIYICMYVYFRSISSLVQISLNITDIFCLHIFLLIRSYCGIAFIVFGENWLMYFP